MEKGTTTIENVEATRDKRKPPGLIVTADVMVYTQDGKAIFKKADPQGITYPHILILDVEVMESGPKKGQMKAVEKFDEQYDEVQQHEKVTVRYKGEEKTVDIKGK